MRALLAEKVGFLHEYKQSKMRAKTDDSKGDTLAPAFASMLASKILKAQGDLRRKDAKPKMLSFNDCFVLMKIRSGAYHSFRNRLKTRAWFLRRMESVGLQGTQEWVLLTNYAQQQVIRVEDTGESAPMWDLCVDDACHQFVAEGTVVHNSLLEQSIDVITTFLFGMTYNRDLFVREKLPKGFLAVMGDVNAGSLRAIKNHWVHEMSGYGGKFRVPIIPSGKDGVGIDWKSLGQSNRDMEYMKLLHLIITLMCAVFSVDPSEIGIKTELAPSLFGKDATKPKLEESRDTGLGSLLMYVETYLNKILHKVDTRYVLKFTGVRDGEARRQADTRKVQLEVSKTIDEFREADGDEPFNQPWSQMPLNPQAVAVYQASAAMGATSPEEPTAEGAASPEEEEAGTFPELSVSEESVAEEPTEKSKANEAYFEITV